MLGLRTELRIHAEKGPKTAIFRLFERKAQKRGKNRLLKKDADRPSLANASSSRRSGRDANKRDEFRASVLRQDSAPFIFARLPKLSIFV